MKVAFDCHVPFVLAHGGVQIQIEQTMAALRRAGVQVQPLAWWDESFQPDIIHFFGKPQLSYVKLVKQKKVRLILADLLTSQGSRTAWQRAPFAAACLLDRAVGGRIREKLGWTVYDLADCCVCLTAWEASLVRSMYGARRARIEVVPNGVEKVFLEPSSSQPRKKHLVTTVTITPRKRVVELVQAAAMAGVKLRVIGRPYHPEDPYFLDFLAAIKQAGGVVEYVGAIEDRKKLAEEYRSAAGFVLLSSMESQSLSALEAAACGCPLLLSDLPWARSSFGDRASYVPVTSPKAMAVNLKNFILGVKKAPLINKIKTWEDVAQRLIKIYDAEIRSR